jgi:hypothetical protein
VFQEFVFTEYGKRDKCAVTLFKFTNEVKDLSSEVPSKALACIQDYHARSRAAAGCGEGGGYVCGRRVCVCVCVCVCMCVCVCVCVERERVK